MGATAVCPGTHYCNDVADDICDDFGFQIYSNLNEQHQVWRAGHGLLLNQQMQHRGVAHSMQNGPQRAMLVLTFAPRPQIRSPLWMGDKVTSMILPFIYPETTMLSQGIPYSLRFDMYGHTLSDLSHTTKRMAFPLTWLRSLRIWKHRSAHWGWDYLTVLTWRVANESPGYHFVDLTNFLEGHWLIGKGNRIQNRKRDEPSPSLLQRLGLVDHLISDSPKIGQHGAYIGGGHSSWHVWALETIKKCQHCFGVMSSIFIASYILGALLYTIAHKIWTGGAGTPFRSTLRRLCFILTLVLFFAGLIVYHIASSPWGQFIASSSYKARASLTPFSCCRVNKKPNGVVVKKSNPTTEPHWNDVLIGTRYDSSHLHMLNAFLDYHPGNVRWQKAISDYSAIHGSYFDYTGSKGLPQEFVENVVDSILSAGTKETTRFLSQNKTSGEWHILPIPDVQLFVFKTLRLQQSLVLKRLYNVLSLLMADNRNCRLGDCFAMSQLSIQRLRTLTELFDSMSGITNSYTTQPQSTTINPNEVSQIFSSIKKPSFVLKRTVLKTQHGPKRVRPIGRYPGGNYSWLPTEQFQSHDLSFFQKGDIVECKYKDVGKWFRATIVAVHTAQFGVKKGGSVRVRHMADKTRSAVTYDVEYFDGYVETYVESHLIQRYKPMKEGDKVYSSVNAKTSWQEAVIARVYVTGTFDVVYRESGEVVAGVQVKDLCRDST
mmetsp:Transcript_25261/g.36639  ORF Transcript_25261/g.36639 Transcript_25261/m.36639 type:complete len:715 (-) Transcript_25261:379-2523(-)